MGLCGREMEREARRVLPRMDGAGLERRGSAFVMTRRAGGRAALRVEPGVVAAFAAEGWIAETGGRWSLTDQGRAFAARASAAVEPFRAQHGDVIDLGASVRQERAGSVLDALARLKDEHGRPYLGALEREAAARLETDFEQAHFRPRLTVNLDVPPRSAIHDCGVVETLSAAALDARRRVMDALDAAGPGLKDMLFEAVCLSRGLNEAERALGWPQRAGKAVVRLGLQRLAEHYGLASGRRRPGRIEAWMEAVAGSG